MDKTFKMKIKNIEKLKGRGVIVDGWSRLITHISTAENRLGETFYCFWFDAVPGAQNKWFNSTEIRLHKRPKYGEYALFVMGLQMVSEVCIDFESLKSPEGLLLKIKECLTKSKTWWESDPKP